MEKKNKKVIVAMSGGVDSSVAAALLKEAGFDVVGIFMRLDGLNFSAKREKRAKAIAKKLNITFYVQDFRKEFKKKVIDYFLKEEKAGRTPNPCVVCNKEIKFKLLFNQLSRFKADYFATGHYARIKNNKLLKGRDRDKDQSYFLWQLNQKLLNKVLFPVGGYTKKEVKRLAENFNLPIGNISESQEICFVKNTTGDFLEKHLGKKPGKIVCAMSNIAHKVIGEHQGLWFYTMGQRKGIKLPGGPAFARLRRATASKPFYVLDKNIKRDILVVTQNEKDLYKKELIAKNINWVSGKKPDFPLQIEAKIRYRHKGAQAEVLETRGNKLKVKFKKSQRAITPGQSIVFYSSSQVFKKNLRGQEKNELLGGGVIDIII